MPGNPVKRYAPPTDRILHNHRPFGYRNSSLFTYLPAGGVGRDEGKAAGPAMRKIKHLSGDN